MFPAVLLLPLVAGLLLFVAAIATDPFQTETI